jgi:L-lactate dehydrogenase
VRQTGWLVDACHVATPRPGGDRVRLPGERALARLRDQTEHGVALHPTILPALAPWGEKLGVRLEY